MRGWKDNVDMDVVLQHPVASLIFTSYSPSHKQTCVKILKFTLFFTSLVHYMSRPIWSPSGASKIAVQNWCTSFSKYNSKVHPRLWPMCCCTSVTCNGNSVSISRMEYIGVSDNVVGCILTCSAGWFLTRVVCSCNECLWSWLSLINCGWCICAAIKCSGPVTWKII
jgi:hypothetical protein